MTHSPGPWVKISRDRLWNEIVSSTNRQIVLVQKNSAYFKVPAEETEGNATLIAAAPELLEACKALLSAFEGYEMLAALDSTVQEQARAAIAKASGECSECGGTGAVIVTSSPGLPEHGSIEQESCPKCNGGAQ